MNSVPQGKPKQQLPNCVREALLGIDAGKTAIVLDLLFTLGYQPGQWITYREALAVCTRYTAVHIVRDGLKHDLIKRQVYPVPRAGRPMYVYQLPFPDDLKEQLCIQKSSISDYLKPGDFANQKAYRMALHRELIQRGYEDEGHQPKKFSRKFMSERLNVTPDTLRRYEHELGTYVEPSYDVIWIRDKVQLWEVPEKRAHNGMYLSIVVDDTRVAKLPARKDIAGMYLKRGYEVNLMRRSCNKYAPYHPYSEQGKRDRYGDWADIINM